MPRKKPFSNKLKKLQLQEKRRKKADSKLIGESSDEEEVSNIEPSNFHGDKTKQSNLQSHHVPDRKLDPNRYRLQFFKESKSEIERRKRQARIVIDRKPEHDLEVDEEEVYRPGSLLDMPKRPSWKIGVSKHNLEANEEKYFQGYLDKILEEYKMEFLSYFDMNLETWRQLWRVLEMSDIILLVVDIRYPVLHFSPALYHYVTEKLHKPVVLVFNKVDLVPASLVIAWKHYLLEKYPQLQIIFFTSFPEESLIEKAGIEEQGSKVKKKRKKGGRYTNAHGSRELFRVCEEIVQNKVDLSSWEEKINMNASGIYDEEDKNDKQEFCDEESDTNPSEQEMYKDGILTIGCVGYPNVGKSSLLNGIVGKKVVSVSKSPGHTKHFQTIYLTPTVKLCDCPGLVFPSLVHKSLQILAGIYPIAQVQEPYSPIAYLGERIDIPALLHLKHPVGEQQWSAYDICEAWAIQRGFLTAKAARPDVYRAANNLLRMALDGRLCLSLRPKGYTAIQDMWKTHQETDKLLSDLERFKHLEDSDSEDGSVEDTDEDIEDMEIFYKEDKSDSSSEEEEHGISTSNPFSLLTHD